VAVASGKGGVGKTTISVNLAAGIAKQGHAVGLLDADIYGPNVPMMLGVKGVPDSSAGRIDPLEKHGVRMMSLGLIAGEDMPIIWRGPIVGKMIQQFITDVDWGALDYLVVDLPPGTGDAQLTLAQTVPLTGVVIVTTPQDVALEDVCRSVEMFRTLDVPVLGVVENMGDFVCPCCGDKVSIFGEQGGSKVADRFGVPLMARIPIARPIRESGDTGTPVVLGGEAEADAFLEVADAVIERTSEMGVGGPQITIT
jgi:ATP-binding protein involved in chromosome partitioning